MNPIALQRLVTTGRNAAVAALLLAASVGAFPYEIELDIGGRGGTAGPAAVGGGSWSASAIEDAVAVRTTGSGEVSVDSAGEAGIDASAAGEASYSFGSLVSGARLAAEAFRAPADGYEYLDLALSAPITLNGDRASLTVSPSVGAGFMDAESVRFGVDAGLAFSAGDFVLKPGLGVAATEYPDGSSGLEVKPSLGVVWYPGLPLTADFSFGWSRTEYGDGSQSTTFPVSASFAAAPFPWLCLTAAYEGRAGGTEAYRHRMEAGVELIRYGERGSALRLPLSFFRTWNEVGDDEFGLTVLVGYSFGAD